MRGLAALATCLAALAVAGMPAFADGDASLYGSVAGSFAAWEDSGSAFFPAGLYGARSASSWLDARAEAGPGDGSRCAIEGRIEVDAATGVISYALRELWAEWRPAESFALRVGRQRIGFGSGFAWNPSNDLDSRRDAADPSAPRQGIDSACLRIEAGKASGFPLSLSAVAVMPGPGLELADARIGTQLYACTGPVELMAVASCSSFGESGERWLLGGWGTVGVGPLVLGLEGAWRRIPDRLSPGADGAPSPRRETSRRSRRRLRSAREISPPCSRPTGTRHPSRARSTAPPSPRGPWPPGPRPCSRRDRPAPFMA